jgi:hypothetical protein
MGHFKEVLGTRRMHFNDQLGQGGWSVQQEEI